jgi:plasmid stabilization system protein ParE
MRVELHPAAREELHHAVDWYIAEVGRDTAARFLAEFEQLQVIARNNPQVGAPGRSH